MVSVRHIVLISLISMTTCTACGSDSSDGQSQGPPCASSADCSDGLVCLDSGFGGLCTPTCSVEANECGGSAACGGVGLLEVNVCKEEKESPQEASPESEPTLPCATDADCGALQPGTLCVQFQNVKECTIPCNLESDCDMPEMMGVSMDFMTCGPDEAQDRMACIPRVECFTNPMSCVTMPGITEGAGFGDDFGDFGDE